MSRSVWSACSLLPLSPVQTARKLKKRPKAAASCTHSIRFATFGRAKHIHCCNSFGARSCWDTGLKPPVLMKASRRCEICGLVTERAFQATPAEQGQPKGAPFKVDLALKLRSQTTV